QLDFGVRFGLGDEGLDDLPVLDLFHHLEVDLELRGRVRGDGDLDDDAQRRNVQDVGDLLSELLEVLNGSGGELDDPNGGLANSIGAFVDDGGGNDRQPSGILAVLPSSPIAVTT